MPKVTRITKRKSDHIRINLEENVQSGITTGLEKCRFAHQSLPEIDLDAIDLSLELFGKKLSAPLLISSMTGGTPEAMKINRVLAQAAQMTGIAMGLGSQRAAIDHPELASTFRIRHLAPDVLLFANLGAIQLNYGYTQEHCSRAVEMVEADALILHLNPLQEAVQAEGQTNFSNLLNKIEAVCRSLPVPVIIKEVGWGISEQVASMLANIGVAAIDVAGAGGTSWSQVEMYRAQNTSQARLAQVFSEWGIPTREAISNVRKCAPGMRIFASGGLRSGVDIAKCIALGASLGGMAGPFLRAASQSLEMTLQEIRIICRQLQVAMFVSGSRNLAELNEDKLIWAQE